MDTRKGLGRAELHVVLGIKLSKDSLIPRGAYRVTSEELAAMSEECPLSGIYRRRMARNEAGASGAHQHTKRQKQRRSA